MAAEAAFVGHGRTGHGVLQALNGPTVARTVRCVADMLAVVLNQGVELGTASVQNPSKVQSDIRRVIRIGLTEFIRPIVEKLPFVSAFFGYFDEIFLHVNSTNR